MTAMKVGSVCFLKVTFCNRVLLVYTFWEPIHFLEQGYDFQTWALSPKIRFEELGQYFSSSSRTAVGVWRQSAILIFTIRNSL